MMTLIRFFIFFVSIFSLCTSVSSSVSADDKKDRELIEAVKTEECSEKIRELYLEGADPNACDGNGDTPLHSAVDKNFIDNAAKLLSLGSTRICTETTYREQFDSEPTRSKIMQNTIDTKNKYGKAAIHLAVQQKNLDMVNLLCDWNADINITNRLGKTPLRIAIDYNAPAIIAELLKRGADVNIADINGDTPLHAAFMNGRTQLMNDLYKKHGADPKAINKQGLDPFNVASPSHSPSFLEELWLTIRLDDLRA